MASVFVVGGAGYVGSQAAKLLVSAGHQVTVYDDLSTGFESLARYGKFVRGDIRDRSTLARALAAAAPDAVMHFAARAEVGESVQNPGLYYEVNVAGTHCLLEEVRVLPRMPVVIFSSTCSVYGITEQPLSEIDAIAPMNPYARSKRMVEEMLADYAAAYGLRYTALRYFNAAGCDPAGEVGELHEPESHLIPRLLLHCLNPAAYTMKIFGEDYPTPDGTCIRDYIHVEDLGRAHLQAMDRLLRGGTSDIFNLGTGRGTSVREVVRAVEKVTGRKLDLPVAPRRPGDPPRLVAGSKKARNLLAWVPEHDLESIVRTAWEWSKAKRV